MLKESCLLAYTTSHNDMFNIFQNSVTDIFHKNDIYIKNENIPPNIHYNIFDREIQYLRRKINTLKNKYKFVIYSNCENYLFYNMKSWSDLYTFINNSSKKIFFMKNTISNDINASFFIIKHEYIPEFLMYIQNNILTSNYAVRNRKMINDTKNKLVFEYIPIKYTIWGYHFSIIHKNNYLLHHPTDNNEYENKEIQINRIKNNMS